MAVCKRSDTSYPNFARLGPTSWQVYRPDIRATSGHDMRYDEMAPEKLMSARDLTQEMWAGFSSEDLYLGSWCG